MFNCNFLRETVHKSLFDPRRLIVLPNKVMKHACMGSCFCALQFDNELRRRWDDAMERGLFRYSLDKSKCRVIPGKYRFAMHVSHQQKEIYMGL